MVATVALRVLSQRALLLLIASFQRGLPGIVSPLLQRLQDDGLLRCCVGPSRSRRERWNESHRITTPLYANVLPKSAWAERVTPEAVARYDSQDLHALRIVVAAAAFNARTARRLLHRTAEAATAFGRVDILQWLHDHKQVFATQPLLASFCVKLATRHEQIAVLEWFVATFTRAALDPLRSYSLRDVVKRGDVEMIRWFTNHKVGVMPSGAAFLAVMQRDVAMLREVLTFPEQVGRRSSNSTRRFGSVQSVALARLAGRLHQLEAVRCIVQLNWAFPIELLQDAIELQDLDTVQCMLNNLRNAQLEGQGVDPASWIVFRLVRNDNTGVLARLSRVESDLLRLKFDPTVLMWAHNPMISDATLDFLLRMSSVSDISTVLMEHAMQGDTTGVEKLLTLVDRPLPAEVLGFVDRVTTDTLGPLASLARTYKSRDRNYHRSPDDHLLATMAHCLPSASRQDARDLVLHLLPDHSPEPLRCVLAADAKRAGGSEQHCDRAFLELCRSLRPSSYYAEHPWIAMVLRQRDAAEAGHLE